MPLSIKFESAKLMFFKKGQMVEYAGKKTKEKLVKYITGGFLKEPLNVWEDIPPEKSVFLERILQDYDTIVEQELYYGVGIFFISGFLLGLTAYHIVSGILKPQIKEKSN